MLKRIKNFLIYYTARAAVFFLGLLPRGSHQRLARVLAAAAYRLARFERETARRQLQDALEIDRGRADILTRGVFYHLASSALELCRLLRRPNKPPRVIIPSKSAAVLEDALAGGKGVIFATGHLGNWELMAIALAKAGFPIATAAKGSYDPRFTRLLDKGRAAFGVRAIYRNSPGSSAAMLRVLKKGGILGVLMDQDTDVQSSFVPFFGKVAKTPVAAAKLATSSGAMLVVGSISRSRSGAHEIVVEQVEPKEDEEATTAELTLRLERRIRKHPSQWVWFHRRWRTRPEEPEMERKEVAA